MSGESFIRTWFCSKTGESSERRCKHKLCASDPVRGLPDDFLIAIATTASSRAVALQAEVLLRKRHPSKMRVR